MWSLGSFEIQEISFKVGGHQDQQAWAIQEMLQIAKLQSFLYTSGSVWSFVLRALWLCFLSYKQNIFIALQCMRCRLNTRHEGLGRRRGLRNSSQENKAKLILHKHVWRSLDQRSLSRVFGNLLGIPTVKSDSTQIVPE